MSSAATDAIGAPSRSVAPKQNARASAECITLTPGKSRGRVAGGHGDGETPFPPIPARDRVLEEGRRLAVQNRERKRASKSPVHGSPGLRRGDPARLLLDQSAVNPHRHVSGAPLSDAAVSFRISSASRVVRVMARNAASIVLAPRECFDCRVIPFDLKFFRERQAVGGAAPNGL